ncbi:exodeoxyribonuclease V subunit alpha [Nocardioides sp.]|uniref:exodeoxyribonuclease V subunit alpha n=1 Tax=Nocardioides sp. TaxID=35761 RepID=UPI003515FE61
MTTLPAPAPRRPLRAAAGLGPLAERLAAHGELEVADVHVAARAAALAQETEPDAVLALALAVRALRQGSVQVDLSTIASRIERDLADGDDPPDLAALPLPWPEPQGWAARVAGSALAAAGVLRVEGDAVYLDRYHRLEQQVADDLAARAEAAPPPVDEQRLAATLARVGDAHLSSEQAEAIERAARSWLTILTGGPGTGKTTTIARLLVVLADQVEPTHGRRLRVALAAPTGKAATRLQEAVTEEWAGLADADRERVGAPEALTLHRLLGWRPDSATRFRHHRGNRLGYDVVVVDECSMVDLLMMGRLLEAVRPDTRLILVGDEHQLTSVGAGAVLGDAVEGLATAPRPVVAALTRNFRSTARIQALAAAVQAGDADAVVELLEAAAVEPGTVDTDDARQGGEVQWLPTATPEAVLRPLLQPVAEQIRAAALAGDGDRALALLQGHRLLCAHREGPAGVRHWNARTEAWLTESQGLALGAATGVPWYAGRPVVVTANDYTLEIYNGETGVVVRDAQRPDGRLRVVLDGGTGPRRDLAPSRVEAVDTLHALTIHKSQGSQARVVTVLLPDAESRLLSRELLYTALTRAEEQVRLVGTEAAVRAAVQRPADRATGLSDRIAARWR